jgi:hypothetical protein
MGQAIVHPAFKHDPYWREIHVDLERTKVAEMIDKGQRRSRNVLLGEMLQERIHEKGGIDYFPFPAKSSGDRPIIREMIDTAQGQMALLEKVRIDVAFGLADIVFLQKFEGGEVQFGTLAKGAPATGAIQTYAAGFEWTEDMIEFDRTYQIELNNQAFGRAYNALLNHLHLSVILGGTYVGGNATAANATGATQAEKTSLTFQAAYQATVLASPRRTGTVLLASEANRFQIETALLTPVNDSQGNPLPNVPITTIIYYDGESITVGSDTYTYSGGSSRNSCITTCASISATRTSRVSWKGSRSVVPVAPCTRTSRTASRSSPCRSG